MTCACTREGVVFVVVRGVILSLELQDRQKPSTDNAGKSSDRRRDRRVWEVFLSLLLAFIGAASALAVSENLASEQGPVAPVGSVARLPTPLPKKTVPGFDKQALKARLEEIAKGHEGTYGVSVLEPTSGTRVSLRGDEEFMSASIGKLPVLATLYQGAARGQLDLEEQISVVPEDIQDYGNGEDLTSFPADYSLSLRQCAYNLVNHSDNIAWAMLNRRLGEDRVRTELEGMGIKNSQYSDHLSGYFTTSDEVLVLLEKISDPKFTNEKLSSEMLDAMTQTDFEDRIPEKLPTDVRVAHKTGSYSDNFGDAGVVFYKDDQGVERHYYLAVLAKGASEYDARDAIQQMSLAVYEVLRGVRVDPQWSRGSADRLENVVDGSLVTQQPAPVEKTQRPEETTMPAKSPLDDKPPALRQPPPSNERSLPESWRNVVPNPPFAFSPPLDPTVQEPVEANKGFIPIFPQWVTEQEEEETTNS
ncbi:MAG: serine hydrolase [Rubrobacter sp.]|nr:serine hydrolase [Rubrobacter sp.]